MENLKKQLEDFKGALPVMKEVKAIDESAFLILDGNIDKSLAEVDKIIIRNNAILESKPFIEALEAAIKKGIEVDYAWNGEDEVRVETFNTDDAIKPVIEALKKYLL